MRKKLVLIGNNSNSTFLLKKMLNDLNLDYEFIDYEKNKSQTIELNIRFIPTLLFYKNDEIVKKMRMPISMSDIQNEID